MDQYVECLKNTQFYSLLYSSLFCFLVFLFSTFFSLSYLHFLHLVSKLEINFRAKIFLWIKLNSALPAYFIEMRPSFWEKSANFATVSHEQASSKWAVGWRWLQITADIDGSVRWAEITLFKLSSLQFEHF